MAATFLVEVLKIDLPPEWQARGARWNRDPDRLSTFVRAGNDKYAQGYQLSLNQAVVQRVPLLFPRWNRPCNAASRLRRGWWIACRK